MFDLDKNAAFYTKNKVTASLLSPTRKADNFAKYNSKHLRFIDCIFYVA